MLIFQNMIKEKNTVFFSGISNVDFSKYEQPPSNHKMSITIKKQC